MEDVGTIMVSIERLKQMSALLERMGGGRKADELGAYLGDGLPHPAELGRLRSNELKAAIDELLEFRSAGNQQ